MSTFLSKDHHLNSNCYYASEVSTTLPTRDKINISVKEHPMLRMTCCLSSEREDLRPASLLSESSFSTGNYGIEVSSNLNKHSKPNFKSCQSGRESFLKSNSFYDNFDKHPHQLTTPLKRYESSSFSINRFASSFFYIFILLTCLFFYVDQSYVATFGYGLVSDIVMN